MKIRSCTQTKWKDIHQSVNSGLVCTVDLLEIFSSDIFVIFFLDCLH